MNLLDRAIVFIVEAAMVVGIIVLVWLWAGATMSDGPAHIYQCSPGNVRPFACP